jgi:selenium metabolism protein YedF
MKIAICFKYERMGRGDDELGRLLLRNYIKVLPETSPLPHRMLFLNGGVRLSTEGSPVIDELLGLSARGVEMLTCGTCLDFFELRDKLRVGRATTMREIASTMLGADRLIEP